MRREEEGEESGRMGGEMRRRGDGGVDVEGEGKRGRV